MLAATPRRRTFYVAMACASAIIALIGSSRRYVFPLAAGTMDAPAIVVATLLSWALLIAGLFSFAIAYVKKPEIHKRLILLATTVILNAAFARIIQPLDHDVSRLVRNDLASLPSDALILVAVLHDWRTRGKPHAAYVIGGAAIVIVQLGTLALRTPANPRADLQLTSTAVTAPASQCPSGSPAGRRSPPESRCHPHPRTLGRNH